MTFGHRAAFENWSLMFLWSLELGYWDFGILSFTHAPSSIHRQHLTCDEVRFIGHEINCRRIQVFGPPDAPAIEWLLGGDELHDRRVLLRALRHRRLDQCRRKHVEANVLAGVKRR